MGRIKLSIVLLWLFVFCLMIWASFKLMITFSEIGLGVVAAFAIVFAALLSHFLNQQKEIRLLQQIEKQRNYEKLLIVLSEFIRNPHEKDSLDSVQLYSWIVGSVKVVEKTKRFVREIDGNSLKSLLDEIRIDIGLKPTNKNIKLEGCIEKELNYLKSKNEVNGFHNYKTTQNSRRRRQAEGLLSRLFGK